MMFLLHWLLHLSLKTNLTPFLLTLRFSPWDLMHLAHISALLLFIIIICSIWKMILFFSFYAPLSSLYTHRRATYLQSVLVGLWLIWHVSVDPNESWGTQGKSELVKSDPCYSPGQQWPLWVVVKIASPLEDNCYSGARPGLECCGDLTEKDTCEISKLGLYYIICVPGL